MQLHQEQDNSVGATIVPVNNTKLPTTINPDHQP